MWWKRVLVCGVYESDKNNILISLKNIWSTITASDPEEFRANYQKWVYFILAHELGHWHDTRIGRWYENATIILTAYFAMTSLTLLAGIFGIIWWLYALLGVVGFTMLWREFLYHLRERSANHFAEMISKTHAGPLKKCFSFLWQDVPKKIK